MNQTGVKQGKDDKTQTHTHTHTQQRAEEEQGRERGEKRLTEAGVRACETRKRANPVKLQIPISHWAQTGIRALRPNPASVHRLNSNLVTLSGNTLHQSYINYHLTIYIKTEIGRAHV